MLADAGTGTSRKHTTPRQAPVLSPGQRLVRIAQQQSSKGFFASSPALTPRSSPHFRAIVAQRGARSADRTSDTKRDHDGATGGMTTWQAGFNVVNLYVGMGLLSKPYALARGGWASLAGLFLLCAISLYTGKVIVRCFGCMEQDHPTYPELGYAAFGRAGRNFISLMIFLEFFGATCIVLLFLWQNIMLLLPDTAAVELWQVAVLVCAVALPTVWMLRFSDLAFLGLLGFVASAFIACVIVGVLLSDTGRIAEQQYSTVDAAGMPVSLGIFMVSLAGHACLPSIYAQMRNPEDFDTMLDYSFAVMLTVYTTIAVAGYLSFGGDAAVLVTDNLLQWPC